MNVLVESVVLVTKAVLEKTLEDVKHAEDQERDSYALMRLSQRRQVVEQKLSRVRQQLAESSKVLNTRQGGHKPGILRNFSEHGKLREFSGNSVQPQGKIVTNKVFLVRYSNICVKQLLTA